MRGGAIPVLAWATLLLVLSIGNWLWDEKPVNAAVAAFAALVIYLWGVGLWLRSRNAVRRGPPEPDPCPKTVPDSSLAAVLVGVAVASILFGVAWAKFLVLFGAGLLVLALGRLVLEFRAERAQRLRTGRRDPR